MSSNKHFTYRRSDWTTLCNNCNESVPKGVMIYRIDRYKRQWAHYYDFECGKEVIPTAGMDRGALGEIITRLRKKEAIDDWDISKWMELIDSGQINTSDLSNGNQNFQSIINHLYPERIFIEKSKFLSEVKIQDSPPLVDRIGSHNGYKKIDWFINLHGSWVNEYLFEVARELDGLSYVKTVSKVSNRLDEFEQPILVKCIDLFELAEYKSICRLLENFAKGDYSEDCKQYILACANAKSQIIRAISEMFATGNIGMEKHERYDRYLLANFRYLHPDNLTPINLG